MVPRQAGTNSQLGKTGASVSCLSVTLMRSKCTPYWKWATMVYFLLQENRRKGKDLTPHFLFLPWLMIPSEANPWDVKYLFPRRVALGTVASLWFFSVHDDFEKDRIGSCQLLEPWKTLFLQSSPPGLCPIVCLKMSDIAAHSFCTAFLETSLK